MRYGEFRKKCEAVSGWQRYALAFLLGAVMTVTLPPVGFVPALLVCVPGLAFLTLNTPTRWKSFFTGWAFGAGYFIFGLYWVSAALFVDIAQWGWALPFSAIAGPTVLGLFYGFIPLMARRWRHDKAAYALAMAVSWGIVEWLRGHLFTGFPWNIPGYAWHWILPVMQSTAFVGIYGLTLLTLVWAMMPALSTRPRLVLGALATLILVLVAGAARLEQNPVTSASDHVVRLVQPNIPQQVKWDNDQDLRNLQKHITLSSAKSALEKPPTIVVWPETAVFADLVQFPDIVDLIARGLPKDSLAIIGALRVVAPDPNAPQFYNSVTVLNANREVLGNHDKHHLVPFGEYIPYRQHIRFRPLALALSGIGDFTRGGGPGTFHAKGYPPFSPLICYEVIFPGRVADRQDRPAWLVNVTNDGWYGKTAGPHQHLAISRARAIEEGLPLARAANTGISAMFDPLGRMIGAQALGTEGVVDTALPLPLPPTLYSRAGDALFAALAILMLLTAEFLLRNRPDISPRQ